MNRRVEDDADVGEIRAELASEFCRVAIAEARGSRSRKRRILTGLGLALLLIVPAGIAVGSSEEPTGPDSATTEPVFLDRGETATFGMLDPATDEPLLCPDGEAFTFTVGPGEPTPPTSSCADGFVPALVTEYERRAQVYLDDHPGKAAVGDGYATPFSPEDVPKLPTYRVDTDAAP